MGNALRARPGDAPIPFTGCDPIAVGICGDKLLTKKLLEANGIECPQPGRRGRLSSTVDRETVSRRRGYRYRSVFSLSDARGREARMRYVEETYRPAGAR